MDRRMLVVMGFGAVLAAMLLAWLTWPDVDGDPAQSLAAPADAAGAPTAQAPIAAADDGQPLRAVRPDQGHPVAALGPTTPNAQGRPGARPVKPPIRTPDPEERRAYRCEAVQKQSELIDKLVTVGSGHVLDDDGKVKILNRVANLAVLVHEEDEAIRAGELSCEDGGSIDLGDARTFMTKARSNLGQMLSEEEAAVVDQTLAMLEAAAPGG